MDGEKSRERLGEGLELILIMAYDDSLCTHLLRPTQKLRRGLEHEQNTCIDWLVIGALFLGRHVRCREFIEKGC